MQLIIHCGTHQIGGSCVEIRSKSARIVIDIGAPLEEKSEKKFPEVKGLYKWDKDSKPVDAVLISHSHLDHHGFLPYINPDIPVYASKGCKELLGVMYYLDQSGYDPHDVRAVPSWCKFFISDITVTPYLVDHSAPDAFAYEIKADGKKIFYSGDFRGHGKKKVLYKYMLKNPPKDIDVLIIEGTTIDRNDEVIRSEDDVEKELVKLFKEKKQLIMFSCSHQNIDRLTVLYNACLKTGRTLVMIPYTAYILDKLKILSKKLPHYDMPQIRVFFERSRYTSKILSDKGLMVRLRKSKISYEEIMADKENMVVLDSHFVRTQFGKRGYLKKALLVYSLWEGYLKDAAKFWNDHKVRIKKVHVSGHASVAQLKMFIKSIAPIKIVPMHTQNPERFRELFGEKVTVLSDGQGMEI